MIVRTAFLADLHVTVHRVHVGDRDFETVLGPVFDNATVRDEARADAEHDLNRDRHTNPAKIWWVVVADDGEALAWCAAWPATGDPSTLTCGENYERRGRGRQLAAYLLPFLARQEWLDGHEGLHAVTYIFDQPVELHERYGWVATGTDDTSDAGHHWRQMRYVT